MTRKNRQKMSARARQRRLGGPYSSQLNLVRRKDGQGPPTVRDRIEWIIVLAKQSRAAYEAWERAVPNGRAQMQQELDFLLRTNDGREHPAGHDEYEEHARRERTLEQALEALPEDGLRKLQAVMYVGRDDDDYERLLRLLRGERHDVRAQMVAEKFPLAEYLEEGLRLVDLRALDLEQPLPAE